MKFGDKKKILIYLPALLLFFLFANLVCPIFPAQADTDPLPFYHSNPPTETQSQNGQSPPKDRWLRVDKLAHLLISLSLVGISYSILTNGELSLDLQYARLVAAGGTALLGITKEIRDYRKGGEFSYKDLTADSIGILLGIRIYTF